MNTCQVLLPVLRLSGEYLSRFFWLPMIFLAMHVQADTTTWAYTVRQGDTLISISKNHLENPSDWVKLQNTNSIKNTKRLPPGMQLHIPVELLKLRETVAEVVRVQREVEIVSAAGGSRFDVAPGTSLRKGDKIRTGKDSNITLRFADGSRLMIMENSQLILDTMTVYGESEVMNTRMRLQKGQVETQAAPLKGPAAHYEIITPVIAVGVRGTDFRVGADADAKVSRSEVLHGAVAVEAEGTQLSVPAGFGTLAEKGKPPLPPVALLKEPDLTELPVLLRRVPLRFHWRAVEGAVSYRAQVYADKEFQELLLGGLFSSSEAEWPDLPDGNYFLRVRAIDKQGLEGLNAERSFTLDARPLPPSISTPADKGIFYGQQIQFQWTRSEDAETYHIQIASSAEFTTLVVEITDFKDVQYTAMLAPGEYYWRIANRIGSDDEGSFSDARSFILKPIPVAPMLSPPQIDSKQITFQWSASDIGYKYQFQLARDEGFHDMLADQTLSESRITVANPGAGNYFMRVKAIGADGFAGSFGASQQMQIPHNRPWWLAIPVLLFMLTL